MKYANLTSAETHLCKEFFDWLLDSIAQFAKTPITETGRHRNMTNKQFNKDFHRIWEYFRQTGMTEFVDAAEKFRVGWRFHRLSTINPEPAKQVRSEWMGLRLWVAYGLATLIHKGSGYVFISEQLESRDVYLDPDAIKMRVNAFKKRKTSRPVGVTIRELFEMFRDRRRHPGKMRTVRWVGQFLTSLTDHDLEFLSKMSGQFQA